MDRSHTLPAAAKRAAHRDSRIVEIHTYPDGWVPNSYRWRAAGRRIVWRRNGPRHWIVDRVETIDRKRSGGNGPDWVCLSAAGGRLASF